MKNEKLLRIVLLLTVMILFAVIMLTGNPPGLVRFINLILVFPLKSILDIIVTVIATGGFLFIMREKKSDSTGKEDVLYTIRFTPVPDGLPTKLQLQGVGFAGSFKNYRVRLIDAHTIALNGDGVHLYYVGNSGSPKYNEVKLRNGDTISTGDQRYRINIERSNVGRT